MQGFAQKSLARESVVTEMLLPSTLIPEFSTILHRNVSLSLSCIAEHIIQANLTLSIHVWMRNGEEAAYFGANSMRH